MDETILDTTVATESFVRPTFVTLAADPDAIEAAKGTNPYRARVTLDVGGIRLDGDAHVAMWVCQSADGQTWSPVISSTDCVFVDVNWDGQLTFLKIVVAVSYPTKVAVNVKTFQRPIFEPADGSRV